MNFTTLAPLLKDMTILNWFITIITMMILSSLPLITKIILDSFKGIKCSSKILLLIKKEVKRESDINELKGEKLKAEMSCADKTMIIVKNMMLRQYKTTTPDGKYLRYYSKILDYTLGKVKKETLLKYVIDNGFEDYHGNDWKIYKERTTKILQSEHVMTLDEEYYSEDFHLRRDKLMELNDPIMHDIKDELFAMFDNMRAVALKYIKKIEVVENEE